MLNRMKVVALAAALTAVMATAQAQTVDDQFASLVSEWVEENAAGYSEVAQVFGKGCLVAGSTDLAATGIETVVAAGGISAGLEAVRAVDPDAYDDYLAKADRCFWTMSVGNFVVPWVASESNESAERENAISICVMDAVHPLPPFVVSAIVQQAVGADFGEAIEVVNQQYSTLVTDLGDQIEACFN